MQSLLDNLKVWEVSMNTAGMGVQRLIKAAIYSKKGLVAAWKHEASFRQEIVAAVVMVPASFLIAVSCVQVAILLAGIFIVLITELINSAIESVVDSTGRYNKFCGQAKDMGSAAVLLALILCAVIWGVVIVQNYFSR